MIGRMVRQFAVTWIALAFASVAAQTGPQVTVGASVTIQVSDRDKTAAAAIARAETMGGYFSVLNSDAVTIKVPANRSRELIDFIKSTWKPVDETYRADDVGASLDELRAGLKSKQELFAQFEGRGFEMYKPLKRSAAVGVNPDVMIERSLTPGCGGAGKVQGAQMIAAERRSDDLDDVGVGAFLSFANYGGKRRDISVGCSERRYASADKMGIKCRQIALQIDDYVRVCARVLFCDGLEHAV